MGDDLKHWRATEGAEVSLVGRDGQEAGHWHVAEEVPVAFVFNGNNHAVMLASPKDLRDFAYGFAFTEGIVDAREDIEAVEFREREQGIDIFITLNDIRLERFELRQKRRLLVGNSSCGVCGIDSVESLFEAPRKVAATVSTFNYQRVIAAVADFQQRQPLKQENHSVHGAGWVDAQGAVALVREDIGRHNALDKLVGAMLLQGMKTEGGFCVVSSRTSYEIVAKAIRMDMPGLVSLSAPTSLAIRTAKAANMAIANWASKGTLAVF